MVNQLRKLSPIIAQISRHMCELLSIKSSWVRGLTQRRPLCGSKQSFRIQCSFIFTIPMQKPVSAHASSNGLCSVLLQGSDTVWKPIGYATYTLPETEVRYAQIEKGGPCNLVGMWKVLWILAGKIVFSSDGPQHFVSEVVACLPASWCRTDEYLSLHPVVRPLNICKFWNIVWKAGQRNSSCLLDWRGIEDFNWQWLQSCFYLEREKWSPRHYRLRLLQGYIKATRALKGVVWELLQQCGALLFQFRLKVWSKVVWIEVNLTENRWM